MMTRRVVLILITCVVLQAQTPSYFPPRHTWAVTTAAEAGFQEDKLKQAIDFIKTAESKSPKDLRRAHDLTFAREAYGEPLGPFTERGSQTGIIVRHGRIVAEWGNPSSVEMTFSVTKSLLSSVVGVALDRGLIRDLHEPVIGYMPDATLFPGERNARITWDHLLRQTSDWEGTLWGKPDWADRPPKDVLFADSISRVHSEPGATWKYNDVRVNLLALAALHVWRKPLPQVLRETILEPIAASNTWRWVGYENSWINLDGVMVQSVSGGGHWGGGLSISARDLARFGLLTLHRGRWEGKQILSENWVRMALTPTGTNKGYGFMNWYLNTGKQYMPSAPETAFCHVGNGANIVYVDPDADTVAVLRWIDAKSLDGFVGRLRAAMVN